MPMYGQMPAPMMNPYGQPMSPYMPAAPIMQPPMGQTPYGYGPQPGYGASAPMVTARVSPRDPGQRTQPYSYDVPISVDAGYGP